MNKSVRTLVIAVLAIITISSMSSCKRGGYGCPYELKSPFTILK